MRKLSKINNREVLDTRLEQPRIGCLCEVPDVIEPGRSIDKL